MPRLPPSLFWRARRASPAAALLLPVCRDLASSLAELRWIREHVSDKRRRHAQSLNGLAARTASVLALCRRRGRGEPLQYVLGTQPFGELDLLCRRGVLIPRPEPEAYSIFLADWLLREIRTTAAAPLPASLTVLDVCSGSGCIALLMYAQLRRGLDALAGKAMKTAATPNRTRLRVFGVDVSPAAVALARANRLRNRLPATDDDTIQFRRADFFDDRWLRAPWLIHQGQGGTVASAVDVVVCNPPYISAASFHHDTARSVRIFEPKLAQVPQVQALTSEEDDGNGCRRHHRPEDVFYVRLLAVAQRLNARIVLCEVGDLAQAKRVATCVLRASASAEVEIWAEEPDGSHGAAQSQSVCVDGVQIRIRGSGRARSVFVRRRV